MRTIHKYFVPIDGTITMPLDAQIVHVAEQMQSVCMWAVVHTDHPPVERRFMIVGTGHPVPEYAVYHGTAHIAISGLVFHIFEVPQ